MAAPEKVEQLISMGYIESEAEQALDIAGGDLEQAVGFLMLSSSDRGGFTGESTQAAASKQADAFSDYYDKMPPPSQPTTSNLKPPPQYSTPPPRPPAKNSNNLKKPPLQSQPPPPAPVEDTFDALKISGMDFVPGNEIPQRGFGNISVPHMTSFRSTVSDITDMDGMRMSSSIRDDSGGGVDDKKVMELVEMGYPMDEAEQALKVSDGDLDQAVGFLLLEKESRQAFMGDVMDSCQIGSPDPKSQTDGDARERANQFLREEEERERLQQEQIELMRKKEQDILVSGHNHHHHTHEKATKTRPSYTNYQTSVNPTNKNVPKMVVTNQGAYDDGSRPFCTCIAARNFLNGGMVNSTYLNSIVKEGHSLSQRAGTTDEYNVGKVLMRFGRTGDLGLISSTVKVGAFEAENIQGDGSLRRLLANVRNEQLTGWEVVVMEVKNSSFCICLPPKGSANKFWLMDLVGRPEFRTEGAYARVHVSLLQLEESLEYIMKIKGRKMGIEKLDFKLFVVKKFQR
ncbi:unnamed protein product [Cylindrotheca closterium]|uniref:UBA domain-containing protein n=1 Tax=Cylindrotheca closterium TaxID=2856 RepID=A0AAD2CBQ3_9STRA|nr:unnamed protein product [Cylindrotheca closterium]